MKKIIALLLVVVMSVFAFTACTPKAMTYDEYMAAEVDAKVIVEAYVQATQSWWEDKITIYLADQDGAYFAYEVICSEEDAAKLTPGTKVRLEGFKAVWGGEIELASGATIKVLDTKDDTFVAEAKDLTDKFGNNEELIKYQNQLASFKGVTISKIEYKNGEPGDDIYVTGTIGEKTVGFCVERYLTDPDSAVYKAFTEETIKVDDKVDIECFLYWYDGANPHITSIKKA